MWVTTSVQPKSVVLTVENTGEKLTPQLVSTLAEPFQRGTKRIRTDHAGVGLGLAIVKSITQAHDGTLTLTPRAAGGLRVTVQLPAAPPHPEAFASKRTVWGQVLGTDSTVLLRAAQGISRTRSTSAPKTHRPTETTAGSAARQRRWRRGDAGLEGRYLPPRRPARVPVRVAKGPTRLTGASDDRAREARARARSSAGNSIKSIGITHSAYAALRRFAATVGR